MITMAVTKKPRGRPVVYALADPDTGEVRYIGQTRNEKQVNPNIIARAREGNAR